MLLFWVLLTFLVLVWCCFASPLRLLCAAFLPSPPPFDGGAFSSLLVSCFTSSSFWVVVVLPPFPSMLVPLEQGFRASIGLILEGTPTGKGGVFRGDSFARSLWSAEVIAALAVDPVA